MSVFSDGGGWYLVNGHLVKIPPWDPLTLSDAIRSQVSPIPGAWRATVGKLMGLASMETLIATLPASERNTLKQAHLQITRELVQEMVAAVTNGGATPSPEDPGGKKVPFGPFGPGGPVLQVSRFLLDVAAELQGGSVRDLLMEHVGRIVARK